MQLIAATAFVASILGVAHGTGVAAVHNKCGTDTYLWSVGDVASNTVGPLTKNAIFNETYRLRSAGGISVKVAGSNVLSDNSTQFEYTLDPEGTPDRKVWYDLSNINGNAFPGVDYKLEPSDSSCPSVYCAAGQSTCSAVYNYATEDTATHACSADADLVFTMCPDGKDTATGDGISGSGSSGSGSNDSTSSSTPASTGPANVVSTGNGVLGESGPPAVAAAAKAASKVATSNNNNDDDNTITWLTATFPKTKREEHAAAHAHSHQHSHQRLRRSRIFRQDEE